MTTSHEVLNNYADDSEVSILSCDQDQLILRVKVDAHGGQIWRIKCSNLVHVDIAPLFILGRVDFGGQELLPYGYLTNRNRGYEGDEDTYRVIRFTDIDENTHFVITYEEEQIEVPKGAT